MKSSNIKKITFTAIMAALAVVGSFVSFPVAGSKCAPVQHFINIICINILCYIVGRSDGIYARKSAHPKGPPAALPALSLRPKPMGSSPTISTNKKSPDKRDFFHCSETSRENPYFDTASLSFRCIIAI